MELLEVPEPTCKDGEVSIEVRRAGICGSELEGVRSQSPFRVPPLIMGHEFVGERVDTGERVAVNPLVSCLVCELCQRGQSNVCRSRQLLGVHRPGGFAERVSVPERSLHPLTASISWEQAALIEPLATVLHGWRLLRGVEPACIGVIGAGTIGLISVIVATRRGVGDIEVAEQVPERAEVARRLGATATGRELAGEYDVVVDAVGAASTRRASVEHLRPGGTALWIGLHADEPNFSALELTRSEKTIQGCFAYTDQDFRQAAKMAGRTDTSFVTNVRLEDGVDAFTSLMNGGTHMVKALLKP
jgi:threonine dehydrogenase-like Zn-dependent dehydrogenase